MATPTPATSFCSIRGEFSSPAPTKKQQPPTLPSPAHSSSSASPNVVVTRTRSDARQGVEETHDIESDGDVYDPIEEAVCLIWDLYCGLPLGGDDDDRLFDLGNQAAYEELHARLDRQKDNLADWFQNNIRHDWDADTGELTIRLMSDPAHDLTQEGARDEIMGRIRGVPQQYPQLATLIAKILPVRQCSVVVKNSGSKQPTWVKSPDFQTRILGDPLPSFVMEIANSQTTKNVTEKVDEWALNVEAVTILVIDLKYARPGGRQEHRYAASVSLYTVKPPLDDLAVLKPLLKPTVFRDADGNAQPGELVIPLKLFFRDRITLPALARSIELRIPFARLAEIVDTAEKGQADKDNTPATAKAQTRKKRLVYEEDDGSLRDREAIRGPSSGRSGPSSKRRKASPAPRRSARLSAGDPEHD